MSKFNFQSNIELVKSLQICICVLKLSLTQWMRSQPLMTGVQWCGGLEEKAEDGWWPVTGDLTRHGSLCWLTPLCTAVQYRAVQASVQLSARPVLQLYLVLRAADITKEGDRGDNFNMSHNYQVTCLPLPAPSPRMGQWVRETGVPPQWMFRMLKIEVKGAGVPARRLLRYDYDFLLAPRAMWRPSPSIDLTWLIEMR